MTRSTSKPLARCACIDIGSNTTRLLVAEDAEPRPRELFSERAFTRLGAGSGASGEISPQKVAEVAAVVARQVLLARALGVDEPRIVATSAVRDACNATQLTDAVAAACGIAPEILSGTDEARLAFAGAIGMLPDPPAGMLGVVDVGGGSTELVVGSSADGVTWSVSLALGSCTVTECDLPSDPPSGRELTRLRAKLRDAFGGLDAPHPAFAYAVGGSATSLQRLVGGVLSHDALARGLNALVSRPAAQVAVALGLNAERARLLPAGLLLLDAASRALGAPLQLAGGGLREGVVMEGLGRLAARSAPPTGSQASDAAQAPD